MEEGEHRERKLQREDDLAEGEEVVDAAVAADADDEDGGEDGEEARDQPAYPWGKAPVHEAFHGDLAGEGAGDGAALAASEQGYGEECAGDSCANEGGKGEVSDLDPV